MLWRVCICYRLKESRYYMLQYSSIITLYTGNLRWYGLATKSLTHFAGGTLYKFTIPSATELEHSFHTSRIGANRYLFLCFTYFTACNMKTQTFNYFFKNCSSTLSTSMIALWGAKKMTQSFRKGPHTSYLERLFIVSKLFSITSDMAVFD